MNMLARREWEKKISCLFRACMLWLAAVRRGVLWVLAVETICLVNYIVS